MIGRSKAATLAVADNERDPLAAFVADDVTREQISRLAAEKGWAAATNRVTAANKSIANNPPIMILFFMVTSNYLQVK